MASMLIVLTLACFVMGSAAMWGRAALPYSLGAFGFFLGLMVNRKKENHATKELSPMVYSACAVYTTIGVSAGNALKHVGQDSSIVFVILYGTISITALITWTIAKRGT